MTHCRGSPVKCLAASPALDVVGVGLADGRAVLHNLRCVCVCVLGQGGDSLGGKVKAAACPCLYTAAGNS